MQVLLFCAQRAEPKIIYSRSQRNDTFTKSTESDNNETMMTTTTMAAVIVNTTVEPSMSSTGHRYADNSMSMSSNADVYGVQYFTPPVIHGTAVNTVELYGRQLHPLQHRHHSRPTTVAYMQNHRHMQLQQHQHQQDGGDDGTSVGPAPILMNPLQVAAYEDPSTVRYSPPPPPRLPQRHRLHVKYAEPAMATLAYQLPLLAAEADDAALMNNLPALQFALQHATGKLHPQPSAITASDQQPYVLPHHHVVKQPTAPLNQLYAQQRHRAPHHSLHHRYAGYGSGGSGFGGTGGGATSRYTQVPFLYSLPAPPPAQRHKQLVPAGEHDLIARFNRLLQQRERDDDYRNRRPVAAGGSGDEDEDEETATRPTVKPKKSKKKKKKKAKKKKKKIQPQPTASPAPVEEDHEDYTDDKSPSQQDQEDDDTVPTNEEQESQNVPTREKVRTFNDH